MDLPILYEDADIVAVNKPAGLLTHRAALGDTPAADDWFKDNYPGGIGYVHRLDKDTSGVLVFAKNQAAHDALRKAFTEREAKKTYLAFVYGVPKERRGVITFDIGRSRKDFRLRSAQPKAKGRLRESLTRYEVVGEDASHTHALLRVEPETGRTHQIRVHLKAIHHPVVGDPLYAPNRLADLGFTRLGLHAYSLELLLPSGVRTRITAPVPTEFASALAKFPKGKELFAPAWDAC